MPRVGEARRRTSQLSPAHEYDVAIGAAVRPASALQMAVAAVGSPQVVVTPVADDETTTALHAVVAASEPCHRHTRAREEERRTDDRRVGTTEVRPRRRHARPSGPGQGVKTRVN